MLLLYVDNRYSITEYFILHKYMLHRHTIHWTRCIQPYSEISVPWATGAIWTKISTKAKGIFLHFPFTFLSVPLRSLLYSSYISRSARPLSRHSERQVLLPISQRDVGSIPDPRTEITERAKANVRRPFSGLIREVA